MVLIYISSTALSLIMAIVIPFFTNIFKVNLPKLCHQSLHSVESKDDH